MAWESPIIRVSTGKLNTVDDSVVANAGSIGSRSRFGGQLGKKVFIDDESIGMMTDTTVGTLYTGLYQYVRLAAASSSPAVGNIVFWDQSASLASFQVTMDPASELSVPLTGQIVAGIALNAITAGNYGFIFVGYGIVDVLFAASITGTKQVGRPVYCSASTPNRADVIDTDPSTTPIWNQYLGVALEAPANSTLSQIDFFGNRAPRS